MRLFAIVTGGMAAGFLAVALAPAAWAGAMGGAVTAVVTAVALGAQAEWSRRADAVRRLPSGLEISAADGRFPLVRELADPITVGVHPAAPVNVGDVPNRVPSYIERDIEPELHTAVRRGGFVLLVGESTAGKTRAAFEAMRLLCGSYSFAAPASREAFQALLEVLPETGDCVVWLDDLERYLGADGLTLPTLHRLLTRRVRMVVLATIRSHEYDRFRDRAENEVVAVDRQAWRECRAVLRQAQVVHVERLWSAEEIGRARSYVADLRVAHALAAAEHFGVAETLAAGPELAEAWRDAWAPGHHPRGAALVAAAAGARRAGYHQPLPVAVLERMHAAFLDERGGDALHPESLADALRWASSPTFPNAANSLLIGSEEQGYRAFDYLIDLARPTELPGSSWAALVEAAAGPDAYLLANHAFLTNRHDRVVSAYRRAAEDGYAPAEGALTDLGTPFGAAAESLERSQQYLSRAREEFGVDHRNTLLAGLSVVTLSMSNGYLGEAQVLAESIADTGRNTLGSDHRITLAARFSSAYCAAKLGSVEAGLAKLDSAVASAAEALGKQDPATASRRIAVVELLAESGNADEARSRLSVLRADYSRCVPGSYIAILLSEVAAKIEAG